MFIACGMGLILNLHEVNKHIDITLSKSNIIIYILLGFLTFLIITIFSKHIFVNSPILNNFTVIGLTFLIFMYLGRFGESDI